MDPTDTGAPGALQLRELDLNGFACKVQPMVIARCSMTACHGNADHAFRLYSPGKLRLGQARTQAERDVQLTADELMANLASARGLAPAGDAVEDSLLLHKPLAPSAGGGEHKGGVLFRDTTDANYQVLLRWLSGDKSGGCAQLDQIQKGMP